MLDSFFPPSWSQQSAQRASQINLLVFYAAIAPIIFFPVRLFWLAASKVFIRSSSTVSASYSLFKAAAAELEHCVSTRPLEEHELRESWKWNQGNQTLFKNKTWSDDFCLFVYFSLAERCYCLIQNAPLGGCYIHFHWQRNQSSSESQRNTHGVSKLSP